MIKNKKKIRETVLDSIEETIQRLRNRRRYKKGDQKEIYDTVIQDLEDLTFSIQDLPQCYCNELATIMDRMKEDRRDHSI